MNAFEKTSKMSKIIFYNLIRLCARLRRKEREREGDRKEKRRKRERERERENVKKQFLLLCEIKSEIGCVLGGGGGQ